MLQITLEGDPTWELWIGLIRQAFSCLDVRTYNWIHLPNKGGYYDQDEFFLIVWEYVRYEYIMAKNDEKFMTSISNKKG